MLSIATTVFAQGCWTRETNILPPIDSSTGQASPVADAHAQRERRLGWLLFLLWFVVVALGTLRHEFWRDEVRAFTLARSATSLTELFALLKDEGHPLLWYLLLHWGYAVTSSKLVLPLISLAVAVAAVAILILRSPLPLWLKALFVFGRMPLFECSVMARNYGLSMLLLFTFAWLYREPRRHPIWMGVVLACLANTNIHSLLLAGLLMSFWLWDELGRKRSPLASPAARGLYFAAMLLAAGAIAAVLTMWPSDQMVPSHPAQYTPWNVIGAIWSTLGDPAKQFGSIAPRLPGLVAVLINLIFIGSTLGLGGRPALLAVAWAAIFALSVLFTVVYAGGYRHQGLFIIFLLTLYWMDFEAGQVLPSGRVASALARAGRYFCLPALLVTSLVSGIYKVAMDVIHETSAGQSFGSYLEAHPEHKGAILIGEPDFYIESMPYYADNPIYIVREQRFGDTVKFTRRAKLHLDLGKLLAEAWRIHALENREVLIALGHLKNLDPLSGGGDDSQPIRYSFGRTFSWSREDLRSWQASTQFLARFADDVTGDERYAIYKVVAPPNKMVAPPL